MSPSVTVHQPSNLITRVLGGLTCVGSQPYTQSYNKQQIHHQRLTNPCCILSFSAPPCSTLVMLTPPVCYDVAKCTVLIGHATVYVCRPFQPIRLQHLHKISQRSLCRQKLGSDQSKIWYNINKICQCQEGHIYKTLYIPWECRCFCEALEVPQASLQAHLASYKHWPSLQNITGLIYIQIPLGRDVSHACACCQHYLYGASYIAHVSRPGLAVYTLERFHLGCYEYLRETHAMGCMLLHIK